jgi:alpha-glucoside transport system substrate-binding protein
MKHHVYTKILHIKEVHMNKWMYVAIAVVLTVPFVALPGSEKAVEEEVEVAEDTGVVSVFGAFRDEEAYLFEESMKPFEDRTGIDVQYEFSSEFETLIFVRVEGGNPPDVAALPQPGLMKSFAEKGALKPLWPEILSRIADNYTPVWKDLGSFNGTPYGVFHRVNVKSLVWYPKKAWERKGYPIPETWDELNSLMDRMVREGEKPWAIGVESGGATGWAATD